ncbi:hypothetical protein AAFP30_04375 [Gordonia sp. CPCC 205515]|uniref:hypothetical protein n=1 Tax=Gordonia sp. CPCC 205515 TaxID=3140791 RepID=UPI003AF343FC
MSVQCSGKSNRMAVGVAAIAGVGAATVALVAPAAAAEPAYLQGVVISTAPGYGSSATGSSNYVYGAGCTYDVDAIMKNYSAAKTPLKITVSNGARSVTLYNRKPGKTLVRSKWQPAGPGIYTITASLDGVTKRTTAKVGYGIQLPANMRDGACVVFPPYY